MKQYIVLLLVAMTAFISCGDDDKKNPIEPTKENKLTKVTCAKNSAPAFALTVTYNQDGQITNIVRDGMFTDIFTYSTNKMSVNSFSSEGGSSPIFYKRFEYETSNGGITKSYKYLLNPYMKNVEYMSDIYKFEYNRNNLTQSNWLETYLPKEDGSDYEKKENLETNNFTWDEGNIKYYKSGTKEMTFTYKNVPQPETFPLGVVNTFNLTGYEAVSPLNFSFGNRNKNLIETAYWYILPDINSIKAKYTFSYNTTGDYVTSMTINEELFDVNGSSSQNTYAYSFEYEYK